MNILSFVYLSVNEYLGCFHFLGIMNNAIINIYIEVFVYTCMFSFLLSIHLGVELRNRMVTVTFNFLRNCFPEWLYHFTISPAT